MDDPSEPKRTKSTKDVLDHEIDRPSETSPLLPGSDASVSSAENEAKSWHHFQISNPFKVEVIHPRFKSVPLLATIIILANEIDFFLKYVLHDRVVLTAHKSSDIFQ